MRSHRATVLGLTLVTGVAFAAGFAAPREWRMHDMERPLPPKVEPGTASTQEEPGEAPSDAVVLFDGTEESLEQWQGREGEPQWRVEDGVLVVVPGTGDIRTKESYGDVQLHAEWMIPEDQKHRTGQNRGNSGIFFMDKYEAQVLGTHDNRTYADGIPGSLYGQRPPLVHATRPDGQWQTYDIVFRRPRFDANGEVESPATMTIFLNGVLVQDNAELVGPTSHSRQAPYSAHPEALPFRLQDHNEPTRFRNIWVRPLEERSQD